MKKIISLVLALAMILAVAVASAHTISVKDTDTHEYRVFQVLTGTLSEEGSKELGDPAWGADVIAEPGSVSDFIASITADGLTQKEIANLVAAKVDTTKAGRGTVKKGSPLTGLATGYYVLVDITELADDSKDTLALNVVEVLNDVNGLAIKYDTTSDDKIIASDTLGKDADEGVNTNIDSDGKADNVSVGDTVNYQIKAKIPSNANLYNYFYFVINDTLSNGLTFTEGSIKVYKDSVADGNLLKLTTDYLVNYPTSGHTFEVGLNDARSLAGKEIYVTYSAVLNKDAELGETGNLNTSTVIFSNDPNHTYDGTNHPSFPGTDDDDAIGETPVTETKTYTTGIEIQKVDQDGNVLTGAEFTITGKSTKIVLTVAETFTKDANGEYYKLKNGTYTKTPPTATGEYMKKAEAGATEGYVIDESYDGDDKKVIDGVTYRPYAPATDEGKQIYVLTTGNGHLYDGTDKYTKSVVGKTQSDATSSHSAKMEVNDNGLARFDGLGAGEYTITETKTPKGYNTLPALKVTISFDDTKTPKWSFSGGNGGYDGEEGIYKITIKNNKGTELPSTGGIGTTIFYILGGLLVVGAAVILVARRKAQD